jgi:hypothetical protein
MIFYSAHASSSEVVIGIEPGVNRKIVITPPENSNGILILRVKNEDGEVVIRTIIFSEDDEEIVIELPDDFVYEELVLNFTSENQEVILQPVDVKIVSQKETQIEAFTVDAAGSQTQTSTQQSDTTVMPSPLPPAIPQQDTNLSR